MKLKQKFKKLATFFYYSLLRNRDSKILFYHDVFSHTSYTKMATSINMFKKHISLINDNGFELVKNIELAKNQILIQFDDGYRGIYDNLDFFLKNNIYVQVFIITSRIGQNGYLSKSEIHEMHKSGNFMVSSHTHSHRDLSSLKDVSVIKEAKISKEILEDIISENVHDICYPRGHFNYRVIELLQSQGYNKQFSSLPGSYFKRIKLIDNVYRRNLVQDDNVVNFKHSLYGAQELLFTNRLKKQYNK